MRFGQIHHRALRLTLADWAKRLDPDGEAAQIASLLRDDSAILADIEFWGDSMRRM